MSHIQPPVPPRIPQSNVQLLIPRLTTTINDIDSFRTLLAQGSQDGTMPNWDVTLQRYSVLLGRITALSEYISQPPPAPPGIQPSTRPALETYLTHPLNPLPKPTEPGADKVSPYASDVYFQVLATQPVGPLTESLQSLLAPGTGWTTRENMRGVGEEELTRLEGRLRERLGREEGRSRGLKDEIERRKEEIDWVMRVDEEEGEDGSLFGDDDEEDEGKGEAGGKEDKSEIAPNPREGWTIQDYVKYMETGIPPPNST